MKTMTGVCLVMLTLAACEEKSAIKTVYVTPFGLFEAPSSPPPMLYDAAPNEAENLIAVGQYNSNDCTSPPLGTIVVADAPGSPVQAGSAAGSITLPSGVCAKKKIPVRCLQITWKGNSPAGTRHHGLRWRYSAGPAQDNDLDVQANVVGGGKAACYSD